MLPFTRKADSAYGSSPSSSSKATTGKGGGLKAFFSGGGGGVATAAAAPGLVPGKPMAPVLLPTVQGGHVLVGAPTGTWQLIFVGRGKACPVTRNYLAAVDSAAEALDALGVEILAVTADRRERAEAFVEEIKAVAGGGEPGFKMAYGLTPDVAGGAWGLYLSEGPAPGGGPAGGERGGGRRSGRGGGGGLVHPEPATLLLDPSGDVVLILKSSSAFGWCDLRILCEGIRYLQTKAGYPVGGTVGVEE